MLECQFCDLGFLVEDSVLREDVCLWLLSSSNC